MKVNLKLGESSLEESPLEEISLESSEGKDKNLSGIKHKLSDT